MNRRSFLLKSAVAAFGFSILPGAGRNWIARASGISVPNPDYETAEFEMRFISYQGDKSLFAPVNYIYHLDPHPIRFTFNPKIGRLEMVPRDSES